MINFTDNHEFEDITIKVESSQIAFCYLVQIKKNKHENKK